MAKSYDVGYLSAALPKSDVRLCWCDCYSNQFHRLFTLGDRLSRKVIRRSLSRDPRRLDRDFLPSLAGP